MARILTLNRYFKYVPGSGRMLDDDEVIEVIHTGLPKAWQLRLLENQFSILGGAEEGTGDH